jgi:hypothetical protein
LLLLLLFAFVIYLYIINPIYCVYLIVIHLFMGPFPPPQYPSQVRHALGGGNHTAVMRQIGTPPPHARDIRDDITCVVVHFDAHGVPQAKL